MRIIDSMAEFLKSEICGRIGSADVYLFGSRADDSKKGEDVDILVLAEHKVDFSTSSKIKINFYKKIDERKLDIIFYRIDGDAAFKKLALMEAIKL